MGEKGGDADRIADREGKGQSKKKIATPLFRRLVGENAARMNRGGGRGEWGARKGSNRAKERRNVEKARILDNLFGGTSLKN